MKIKQFKELIEKFIDISTYYLAHSDVIHKLFCYEKEIIFTYNDFIIKINENRIFLTYKDMKLIDIDNIVLGNYYNSFINDENICKLYPTQQVAWMLVFKEKALSKKANYIITTDLDYSNDDEISIYEFNTLLKYNESQTNSLMLANTIYNKLSQYYDRVIMFNNIFSCIPQFSIHFDTYNMIDEEIMNELSTELTSLLNEYIEKGNKTWQSEIQ